MSRFWYIGLLQLPYRDPSPINQRGHRVISHRFNLRRHRLHTLLSTRWPALHLPITRETMRWPTVTTTHNPAPQRVTLHYSPSMATAITASTTTTTCSIIIRRIGEPQLCLHRCCRRLRRPAILRLRRRLRLLTGSIIRLLRRPTHRHPSAHITWAYR
jgi:hypothetical protein